MSPHERETAARTAARTAAEINHNPKPQILGLISIKYKICQKNLSFENMHAHARARARARTNTHTRLLLRPTHTRKRARAHTQVLDAERLKAVADRKVSI